MFRFSTRFAATFPIISTIATHSTLPTMQNLSAEITYVKHITHRLMLGQFDGTNGQHSRIVLVKTSTDWANVLLELRAKYPDLVCLHVNPKTCELTESLETMLRHKIGRPISQLSCRTLIERDARALIIVENAEELYRTRSVANRESIQDLAFWGDRTGTRTVVLLVSTNADLPKLAYCMHAGTDLATQFPGVVGAVDLNNTKYRVSMLK